jgi:hypothetical protein
MENSAIQSDVPSNESTENMNGTAPTAGDEKELPKSARELAMESISSNRNEQFEKESGLKLAAPDAATEDEPGSNAAKDNQLAAQLDDGTLLSEGLDKLRVKRKVDGIESEITIEQLLRDNQKSAAADKRLAEATRILSEANEERARIEAMKQAGVTNNQTVLDTQPKEGANTAKEFLQSLFQGDEEKALETLTQLTQGRQADKPTLDEAELAKKLTPAIKQQLVVESALEKFAADYADIVNDPYLANVADGFMEAEMKEGKSFTEALNTAGGKTRDWIREKAGVKKDVPNPTTTRNEKLDRKATIDEVAATNAKAVTREDPQQTTSDVIADMRKARGLTV